MKVDVYAYSIISFKLCYALTEMPFLERYSDVFQLLLVIITHDVPALLPKTQQNNTKKVHNYGY